MSVLVKKKAVEYSLVLQKIKSAFNVQRKKAGRIYYVL